MTTALSLIARSARRGRVHRGASRRGRLSLLARRCDLGAPATSSCRSTRRLLRTRCPSRRPLRRSRRRSPLRRTRPAGRRIPSVEPEPPSARRNSGGGEHQTGLARTPRRAGGASRLRPRSHRRQLRPPRPATCSRRRRSCLPPGAGDDLRSPAGRRLHARIGRLGRRRTHRGARQLFPLRIDRDRRGADPRAGRARACGPSGGAGQRQRRGARARGQLRQHDAVLQPVRRWWWWRRRAGHADRARPRDRGPHDAAGLESKLFATRRLSGGRRHTYPQSSTPASRSGWQKGATPGACHPAINSNQETYP